MSDPSPDTYSEPETVARREAALKNMLAMPPKPRKPIGKRGKESSQGK